MKPKPRYDAGRLNAFLESSPSARYDRTKVQAFIDKYSDGKSPLNADFFINLSANYDIPLELMLAQAAAESNFGTRGRGARTRNIFNIGNYTQGDIYPPGHELNRKYSTPMSDWEKGAVAYAATMRKDYLTGGKDMQQLLDNFVNVSGNRYAANPKYEKDLKFIINKADLGKTMYTPSLYNTPVYTPAIFTPPFANRRRIRTNLNTSATVSR